MKRKLSIDEQIEHLKSKNVTFGIMSEGEAKQFLSKNTYYFKIKSYLKAFERKSNGSYINVDFAYLVELSKLDTHLREFIIQLSLDIEHMLKVKLIDDITNDTSQDGYTIVNVLFTKYPRIHSSLHSKMYNSATADLINKYENIGWNVWSIIEVLSFGDFIKLYEIYYSNKNDSVFDLLWSLKFIRNASAHNNCLLNSLRIPYSHSNISKDDGDEIVRTKKVTTYLSKIPNLNSVSRNKKKSNPVVHDFIASLILFDLVWDSEALREKTFKNLDNLFKTRFLKHKEYFTKDLYLVSLYKFCVKIIDFIEKKHNNINGEQKL